MAIGRPISLTPNIATKAINSVATANQTDFTVTGGYRINELAVYRNGVRLAQGRDFTANDGTTVTLTNGATVNDVIEFVVFDSFNVADAIVSVASSQTVTGDLNVTGKFYSGSIDPNSLNAGVGTFNTQIHVGSALTADASGNLNTVGVVTATSFSGDGSALTGLANTDFVVSVATTTGNLNVSAAATITGALSGSTGTFSGAVNVDATTDSTSSSTGALIVDGGLGVAKNVYIGAGLSVAGTLTYEDVTNVDSVGLITAKSGVNVSGGQVTIGTGITMGIAGVATFSGTADVHLTDNVVLSLGDSSDLKLWHNNSDGHVVNYTGGLNLQGNTVRMKTENGGETYLTAAQNGSVDIYYDDSKKFETTLEGTAITGVTTVTESGTGNGMGNITAATASGGGNAGFKFATNSTGRFQVTTIGSAGAESLRVYDINNSAERLRIDSSGRLLLGTTTEGHSNSDDLTIAGSGNQGITVRSGTSNNGSVFFSDGTSGADEYRGWVQYTHTSDYLTFGTNASEKVRIDSSGKVGIGSETPSELLSIMADGPCGLELKDSGHGEAATTLKIGNQGKDFAITVPEDVNYTLTNGNYKVTTGGTERVRITSAGVIDVNGGDVELSGTAAGVASCTWDASANSLNFNDNSAAKFGNSLDLQIYHDGTDNIIKAAGSATPIKIQGHASNASTVHISARSDKETIKCLNNSNAPYVELYYNNSKKFETTNDGTVTTGVCTATSFSGSGANLTGIDASPTVSGICTGSVAAHKAIMVNSSGQFKTPTGQSESTGSEQLFESSDGAGRVQFLYMADLDKYALIYTDPDDNNKIWARVGTRSGTSFSYGTVTEIYNNGSDCLSADYMGGGKIIMTANPNGRVSLLSVSGTSISEESGATTTTTYVSTFVVRAVSSTKAILVYRRTYDGKIYAVVITRSGTSISLGSAAEIYNNVGTENQLEAVWNPTRSKLLVIWKHGSNDGWYAKSLTYSGTSIVENTDTVQLTGGNAATNKSYPKVAYDPVSTNIILTLTGGASGTSRIFVLTQSAQTSGTDIAFGSAQGDTGVAWAENDNTVDSGCYGMSCDGQGNIFISFKNADDSYQTYGVHLTISGTTITLVSGPTETNSTSGTSGGYFGATVARFSVDESPEDIVFPFTFTKPTGGSQKAGVAVKLLDGTDLTAENFIGFSDASGGSSGDTITVKVVGNTTTQSSLTAGQVYYVQNDGTLGTTAADPSVVAGRAISSTSLLIQPV